MKDYLIDKRLLIFYFYLLILVILCASTRYDLHSILFIVALFLCSISFFSILKKFNRFPILRLLILVFPSVFYVINIIPISINFDLLTKDDIMAVLQTNPSEAINYLVGSLHWYMFLPLVIIWFVFVILSVKQNTYKKNLIKNGYIAFTFFIVGTGLLFCNRHNLLLKPIYEAVPQIQGYYHFYNNLKDKRELSAIQKNTQEGIYVVVIGESQNRNRMSVYGYNHCNTTPYLTKIKENKNWLFFDNIYSCHTHTIATLTYALTQTNNYNTIELENAYNIMDVLHEFDTYWISNQKAVGFWGEPITEIGLQAKHPIFINKSFIGTDPYDESLLKYLPKEKQLKGTSVIFIHLLGNHSPYKNRYPKNFNKWYNSYNNSILYNDYIIQKIYEHFSSMKEFMSLVYFADHADDMKCSCHRSRQFTWEMTKIPFFMYFSDSYIKQHPEKIKTLKENLHTPFTNDMFFDTFLGILDITDQQFYIPENDLSNKKYNHSQKDLSILHGEKPLSDELQMQNIEKFYLHRVNSPEKLRELGHKYAGLEMDIIYYPKENDFENSHNSKNLSAFSLDKTLNMYSKMEKKQSLWFDFKNLTDTNKINAEKKLSELMEKYSINKKDVWVESKNYDALEYFTQKGWHTSYYFPYYNFEKMSKKEIEKIRKLTEDISFSGKVSAISFAGQYYSFIKSLSLNKKISLLTWFDQYTLSDFQKKSEYSHLIQDPQLKIILIKEWGKYHR